MFKKLENKKGVTLVELLAVIVIMGIVAAIAVPTIGTLIENQKSNAAQATYDNIKEAARLWALDTDGATTATIDVDTNDLSDYIDLTNVVIGGSLVFTDTGSSASITTFTTFTVDGYSVIS